MIKLLRVVAPAVCLALATGTAFADGKETGKQKSSTRTATAPTAPKPAAAAFLSPAGEGRRAWLKYNCYGCHGMRAAGGMGPDVAHEGGEVSEAVREGEDEGMPAYGTLLNATELSNLRAYLQSIGTTAEPTFNDWWVPVPTK